MRTLTVAGTISALALASGVLTVAPAVAKGSCTPSAGVRASRSTVQGRVDCLTNETTKPANKRAGKKGGKSVKPACVWVPEPAYQPGPGQKANGAGGNWYRKFCSFGDYQTLADFEREMGTWDVMNMRQSNMMRRAGLETRWFATPPPTPVPTPEQVMQSIVDELPVPTPYIAVNPVATRQLVGFPTWVWLTDEKGHFDPDRYQLEPKVIPLGGIRLEWRAVPEITLAPGDGGSEQPCNGAGVPWSAAAENDPAACKVTYEKSGLYNLTATVGWTVQWSINGVQQPELAAQTDTATRPITVLEVQALTR